MPSPKDTAPLPTDNVQVRKLRQGKPQNLNPGALDMPQSHQTSAEVCAEKEKKASKKEAAAVKTKAAKARVDKIKEVLRREQAEVDTPPEPAKKVGGQKKNTPQTSGRGVQPKVGTKPVATSSATETAIDSTMVSVIVFWASKTRVLTETLQPITTGESTVSTEEYRNDVMVVDESQDPATLNENFRAPTDSRNRKVRLMAALQHHQIPSSNTKTGTR